MSRDLRILKLQFVYNMFCFDRWWKNVYRDTPPTYANFVTVWNNVCPFLKLKQVRRVWLMTKRCP